MKDYFFAKIHIKFEAHLLTCLNNLREASYFLHFLEQDLFPPFTNYA